MAQVVDGNSLRGTGSVNTEGWTAGVIKAFTLASSTGEQSGSGYFTFEVVPNSSHNYEDILDLASGSVTFHPVSEKFRVSLNHGPYKFSIFKPIITSTERWFFTPHFNIDPGQVRYRGTGNFPEITIS